MFSPIAVGLLGKFIWWGVFYVICVDVEPEARVKCEVGRPITGLNPQWAPILAHWPFQGGTPVFSFLPYFAVCDRLLCFCIELLVFLCLTGWYLYLLYFLSYDILHSLRAHYANPRMGSDAYWRFSDYPLAYTT